MPAGMASPREQCPRHDEIPFTLRHNRQSMNEHFSPAWWLPGAHLQTVWGRLTRPRVLVAYRRETLPTPDGDEIVLDHLDIPGSRIRTILLHGLEGSSYSVYIQGLVTLLETRGISSTVFNFRSCAKN